MTRRSGPLCLAAALLSVSTGVSGQNRAGTPLARRRLANGDWPHYTADIRGTKYSPLDADRRHQLQQARGRLALQDRHPRSAARVQARRHAARDQRRALHDRRHAAIGRRARRQDRRAAVGAQPARGQARRRLAAPAVGTRPVLLDRRPRRRSHPLRHDRLSPRRAQREERRADQRLRQGRHRRSEGRRRVRRRPADRSRDRRDRLARDAGDREGRRHRRLVVPRRRDRQHAQQHQGAGPRASTCAPASCSGRSTRFRCPGEFGNDTWEKDSWAVNGNNGVWTQITVDEELGLVYLPVETPTSDYYGGHRPGNNLFAESLVCVDLKTGQRKWHFQLVHHPLWNYDMSSAPILADITVNGRAIKAVAVPGKQAFLFVFDRVTGQPVWPIEERPVPQVRRARREDEPDAAVPDQAAGLRAQLPEGAGRSDRLHAGAARAGAQEHRALQGRAVDVQPAGARQRQRHPRRDQHGQRGRRHQLAGHRLRSGDAHRVREREQRRHHVGIAGPAAAELLGHPLRLGPRRTAVHGSARTGRLLRGRFTARAWRKPRPSARQPRRRRLRLPPRQPRMRRPSAAAPAAACSSTA